MSLSKKKEYKDWITKNYSKLVNVAKRYTEFPFDLVSHVYIRVEKADLNKVMEKPFSYFAKAMHIEATRGTFKEMYKQSQPILKEPKFTVADLSKSLMREQLEIFTDRLNWFDKTVFKLWLEGNNISQVARESGIPHETLHTSLYRTKKKIKNAFSQLKNKE
jgi:DNA-directed RNA polymerase specialized sigma24 family protein